MERIGQALLIGAVVGFVVGGLAMFVLPVFKLTEFTFPIVIGGVIGVTSALVLAPRKEKIPLPM